MKKKREFKVWDSRFNIMWIPDEEVVTLYDVINIGRQEYGTLLESIGLEDKNGRLIFEHDVVERRELDSSHSELCFVLYDHRECKYVLAPLKYLSSYKQDEFPKVVYKITEEDSFNLEVVGDIYHMKIEKEKTIPKENLTEIVVVLDKSGSMDAIKQDAIGGFNSFLKSQKELPGDALFTLVLFDTEYDIVYNGTPIHLVQELNEQTYVPGGCTALLDAIGKTITMVHKRLSAVDETQRPSKVIFAILTDGQENSSKEFSRSVIFDKITYNKEQNNWEFIFLAANQDAIAEGGSLGISSSHALNFVADSAGTKLAMNAMNQAVTSFRVGDDINFLNDVLGIGDINE